MAFDPSKVSRHAPCPSFALCLCVGMRCVGMHAVCRVLCLVPQVRAWRKDDAGVAALRLDRFSWATLKPQFEEVLFPKAV